jgi:hypothetical protein
MITDKPPKSRTAVPFVCRFAQLSSSTEQVFFKDVPANDDPLPAVLNIDAAGYVVSNQTRYTYVERETTDDK